MTDGGKTMKPANIRNILRLFCCCLLSVILAYSSALAKEPSADTMQALIEKLKADKKLIVSENMELTDAEAKKFWPVYEQYQNELFILRVRSLNLIKAYADSYSSMTNETAKKLLDEYLTIESLRQKVREGYLPKFRKVLPEMKVARYYQIENKILAIVNYELASQIPFVKSDR